MKHYAVTSRTTGVTSTVVHRATLHSEDLSAWLSTTYARIFAFLADNGLHPTGAPFARYHRVGVGRYRVEAGFPVASCVEGCSELENSALPSGWVATTTRSSLLAGIDDAYGAIASWMEERKAERSGDPWEVYRSDPQMRTDPAGWRAEINQPFVPSARAEPRPPDSG